MARRGTGAASFNGLFQRICWGIVTAFFACMSVLSAPVGAEELEQPQDDIILTISGKVSNHNAEGLVYLDRSMIEAIGLNEVVTHTVYSTKAHQWHGVLMRDLLAYVGAKGETVEVHALDGYQTEIPVHDFYDYDVLLATRQDGRNLSVRRRGPIRIIYPIDHDSSLLDPKYTARFVWQIEKMIVK